MNDREAMQALLDGKKITRRHSHIDFYLNIINQELTASEGFLPHFRGSNADESDWEIYEDPEPSLKIEVTQDALDDVWNTVRCLHADRKLGFLATNDNPITLRTINNGLRLILEHQ